MLPARRITEGRSPLRVRLLEPPRKGYRRLETVPFEISIENVSDHDVVLPWSPVHMSVTSAPPPGYRHLVLDFVFTRRGKPDWILATLQLSASNVSREPERLKTLMPHERIVVRAPMVLTPGRDRDADDPVLRADVGHMKLAVRFDAPDDPLTTTFGSRYADKTVRLELQATVPAVQPTPATVLTPTILRIRPDSVSPGMTLRLDGFRLGADRVRMESDRPLARYFFSNGSARVATTVRGQANASAGNPDTVPQFVTIAVPDTLAPGVWSVVVEIDGKEGTSPLPVSVTGWLPPKLERLAPERVNPGAVISISGAYFRPSDSLSGFGPSGALELPERAGSGPNSISFVVPADAAEGTHTVRIHAYRPGARVAEPSEESLSYVVEHKPLAPVLRSRVDVAFGVGQWTVIQGTRPFSWSEDTEVEFTQGDAHVVTKPVTPKATRVRIPAGLNPGSVMVRARIWHAGVASDWSAPVEYRVALAPVPPDVVAVYVGTLQQRVSLAKASPAREFNASAGDTIYLSAFWPISFDAVIPVTLQRGSQTVRLSTKWTNQSNIQFAIPADLKGGPWTITTGAIDGTPAFTLPAVMNIR